MKKKKVLRFIAWVAVGIITLIVLLYASVDWYGARVWQKTEAALRAQGEPTHIAEIIPPPVPDAENFALSAIFDGVFDSEAFTEHGRQAYRTKFTAATERFNNLGLPNRPDQPRMPGLKSSTPVDLVAWQTFFRSQPVFQVPTSDVSAADDVLLALQNWHAPLDQIARDLRARTKMRAPVHYERGFGLSLPHLTGMTGIARLFELRACARIDRGDPTAAFEDLQSILLLRQKTEPNVTLIGHLVAMSIDGIAFEVLREGLAAEAWDESKLLTASQEFGKINSLTELAADLRVERAGFLDATRRINAYEIGLMTGTTDTPLLPKQPFWQKAVIWGVFHLPKGIWELDRSLYSQLLQKQIDYTAHAAQGFIDVSISRRLEAEVEAKSKSLTPSPHLLTALALPMLGSMTAMSAAHAATLREACVAIAVERFRRAKGTLPTSLAALAPDFLPSEPLDPIDKQPLRYQISPDGTYRLWSIGWDEKDDGGVAGKKATEGDWVWSSLPQVSRQ